MSLTQFTTNAQRPGKKITGFTLIEVLVTIVVVSIGLLGLAGLQIDGLRANMSSESRSKATLLADDITERMRANPVGVTAGAYNGIAASETLCGGIPPAPFCSSTSDNSSVVPPSCTEIEMAAFDAWVWSCGIAAAGVQKGGVANQLPGGTANVICNDNNLADANPCSPGSPHTVTVRWNELNTTDGMNTPQSQSQVSLTVVP